MSTTRVLTLLIVFCLAWRIIDADETRSISAEILFHTPGSLKTYQEIGASLQVNFQLNNWGDAQGQVIYVNLTRVTGITDNYPIVSNSPGGVGIAWYEMIPGIDTLFAYTTSADGQMFISPTVTIVWIQKQVCVLGESQCIDRGSYKVCRMTYDNTNYWDVSGSCCDGFECLQDGNIAKCNRIIDAFSSPSTSLSISASPSPYIPVTSCIRGHMKCNDQASYAICDYVTRVDLGWINKKCQTGTVCQASGNSIYCL